MPPKNVKLIQEHVQAHRPPANTFIYPPEDPLPSPISRKLPDKNEFREYLKARLSKVQYPHESVKTQTSTYEYLHCRGVAESLLEDRVVLNLWGSLRDYRSGKLKRESSHAALGANTYRRRFHLKMMWEIFDHVQRVRGLMRDYDIDNSWANRYLNAANNQLRKDCDVWSHGPQSDDKKLQIESESASFRHFVVSVNLLFERWLSDNNIKNLELAYHLTSIVCTWPDEDDRLYPTPKSLGKLVRRWRLDKRPNNR